MTMLTRNQIIHITIIEVIHKTLNVPYERILEVLTKYYKEKRE